MTIPGKAIGAAIVSLALIAGAAMYYLQVHAFYHEVEGDAGLSLTLLATDEPDPIPADNLRAIDADSSPLRFRACFDTPLSLSMATETYVMVGDAVPLNAPGWFDCFDAAAIGRDLADGTALAFLSQKNVAHGVDRIVALYDDGRAFAWHALNDCGETDYAGTPVGEACPERGE